MESLQLSDCQLLFEEGALVEVEFERVPLDTGWIIVIRRKTGSQLQLSDTRSTSPRIFRKLDTAVRVAERIGFQVSCLRCIG